MLGCKYSLELNGSTLGFKTQEELEDFIDKNYERIETSLKGGSVRFSKTADSQAEAVAKLIAIKQKSAASVTFDSEGNKVERATLPGYKGVSRVLEDLYDGTHRIFTPFDKEAFIRSETAKNFQKLKANNTDNKPDADLQVDALEQADTVVKSWEVFQKLGIDIHGVANIFFNQDGISPDQLYESYKVENPLIGKSLMDDLYVAFTSLKSLLNQNLGKNLRYFSEIPLYDEDEKIVGILDLVVVDDKGSIHILDFKTSNKRLDDWDRDKRNKSKYQLALYRQLGIKNGLKVRNLYIMPLNLKEMYVGNKSVSRIETEPDLLTPITAVIDSVEPKVSRIARSTIPAGNVTPMDIKKTGNLQKSFYSLYPIDKQMVSISEFRDKEIKINNKGQYFRDHNNTERYLTGDKEQDDQIINNYLLERLSSKQNIAGDIKEYIITEKLKFESTKGHFDFRNPFPFYTPQVLENSRKVFERYLTPQWELLDEMQELESNGIIAFRDKERGFIEFLVLTGEDFYKEYKLAMGTTLLGNYLPDTHKTIISNKVPKANSKNLDGIKILLYLNEHSEAFKTSSVNMVRTFNFATGALEGVNVHNMIDVTEYLVDELKQPFNLRDIKFTSYNDVLLSEISAVLEHSNTVTPKSREFLTNIKGTVTTNRPDDNVELARDLVELQKRFTREFPAFMDSDRIDYSSDMGRIYGWLNGMILELKGVKRLDFMEKDMVELGVNNSYLFTPYNEIQSTVIRTALEPVRRAMSNMAQQYVELNPKIRAIFDKFYTAKGVSNLIGDHQWSFNRLFEQDADHKMDRKYRFKNPDANIGDREYLNKAEREFLHSILPIIAEYMYDNKNIEDRKKSGEYYNVPLLRAGATSRILEKGGIFNAVFNNYRDALELVNVFDTEDTAVQKHSKELNEIYDSFAISKNPQLRDNLINEYKNGIEFEKNIELVLSQLVFAKMKKDAYDSALPVVHATLAASQAQQIGLNSKAMDISYKYIRDYLKTVVFDDKLTERHMDKTVRGAATIKHAVTILQLGLSPVNLIRETLQGQFANVIKIWSKRYGDTGPELKHYTEALKIMLVDENFGVGDNEVFIKNVTMVEELNHFYRMAGMDTHDLAARMRMSKTGMTQFFSRWFLWTSSAPDYMNRMSFMIAKMLKDGSYEAHTMKDGVLKYDWTKDKRFSVYAKGEAGKKEDSDLYDLQRSLYLKYIDDFNAEATDTSIRDKALVEGDALPMAYTNTERESVKAFVNYMHGPYDKEEKILANSTFLGMLFMQFKTWMLSKKTQYFLSPDKYIIGEYKHKKNLKGELLYVKLLEDGTQKIVTEKTNQPLVDWDGRYMEGVFVSLMRTVKEVAKNGTDVQTTLEFFKNNPEVISNFKMASADLALFSVFAILIAGVIDWPELEKDDKAAAAFFQAVITSTNDLWIGNPITAFVNPQSMFPAVGYIYDQVGSTLDAMTGKKNFTNVVKNSTAFTRQLDSFTDVFEEE